MDQTRVVLDCDTANEVDDQFAIAHALGLPVGTLDVRGVISVHNTTAHGPGSRDMYQEEAVRVVALCASDVPCVPERTARWRAWRSRCLVRASISWWKKRV
jgi:inosine-uridine nucleoside N-ribohydrolase